MVTDMEIGMDKTREKEYNIILIKEKGEAGMKLKMWKRLMAFCMAVVLIVGSANLTSIAADTTQYKGDQAQEGQLAEGTFVKETDAYYGTATFYDYYSVPELEGVKLSDNPFTNSAYGGKYSYDTQMKLFNTALSGYYEEKGYTSENKKYPLYVGGWNGWPENAYGINMTPTVNGWDDDKHLAMGMVDNYTKGGMLTQNGIVMPYFNPEFLRGDNILDTEVGQVYSDVQFPFLKNAQGYWEFQSSRDTDSLEMKKSNNKGYYLERRTNAIPNPQHPNESNGFFPLEQNDGYTYSEYRNNMFGMHMDIPFYMTEDGQIKMSDGTKDDVVFEFAGDDDVWIFIDGVLVLDVGGIHGANGGRVNFRSGEVTYINTYTDVLSDTTAKAKNLHELETADGINLYDSILDGEHHKICIFYLERGMYDSNLHIKFNFQVQSKLTVTKTVDTQAANPVFEGLLKNIDAFDYYLYNQAVTGETLAVEDSVGYIDMVGEHVLVTGEEQSGMSIENYSISVRGNVTYDGEKVIKYTTSQWGYYTPSEKEWYDGSTTVNNRSLIIQTTGTSFDVSDYDYLKMSLRCTSESKNGAELYVRLNYNDGSSWGNTADKLTYEKNNNYIGPSDWNTVYIDLSSQDKGVVESISLAYRMGPSQTFYINEIAAYGSWDLNESTGFSVEQKQISDYTSIANGKLMPVTGAIFSKWTGDASTVYSVDEEGKFSLANGQAAVFTDKFRYGSYLYLHEIMTEEQKKVFDTTYTMYEGIDDVYTKIDSSSLVSDKKNTVTIQNSGNLSTLTNVKGYTVSDERTTVVEGTSVTADESGLPIKDETNNTFVYRNYSDPDSAEEKGVDLKIDYVNTLKAGSVTIEKVLQWEDQDGDGKDDTSTLDWNTFKNTFIKSDKEQENESVTFRFTFTNIAGQDLEGDAEFTSEMNVYFSEYDDNARTITGTGVFNGIPSGTQYKVEELQTGGMQLQYMGAKVILSGKEQHRLLGNNSSGLGGSGRTSYGEAVAYQGDATYTYINRFVKTQDIKVIKQWDSSVKNVSQNKQVTVRLQRKITNGEWETVGEQKTVNLSTTFTNLPTIDANNQRYEYKVVETAVDGANVSDYVVFYTINADGSRTVINASVDRTYYVQQAVTRELPILPENETDKQQVYDNYTITIKDINNIDVTDIYFDIWKDGTVNYTAPSVGAAMYKVVFTPKKDNTLITQTINVVVYAYDADDDAYVLDYVKPISLNLFANDAYTVVQDDTVTNEVVGVADASKGIYGESASIKNDNGELVGNGILELTRKTAKKDGSSTSAKFTPTRFMSSEDWYLYKTIIRSEESTGLDESIVAKDATAGVVMSADIKVIPASNVYYEDTFVTDTSNGTVGIVYNGNWTVDGNASGNTEQPNGAVQGWESSLSDDTGYSDGSAHMTSTPGAGATFTFTGRGVDVYTRTNQDSGIIMAMLYKGASTNQVAMKFITMDNLAKNGDYYQVPTLSFMDLEYGEYTVKIVVSKPAKETRATYYLDGIRVYNPLENNVYGDEKNTIYTEVRDCLKITEGNLVQGAVFIDSDSDGNIDTQVKETLDIFGPKNEIYLAKGQAVAFVVNYDSNARYQVGLKSLTGAKLSAIVSGDEIIIGHTTDLYYSIATKNLSESNNVVIIMNQSEGVLAITKLKVTNAPQVLKTSVFSMMQEEFLVAYAMKRENDNPIEDDQMTDQDIKEEIIDTEETETQIKNLDVISNKLMEGLAGWF